MKHLRAGPFDLAGAGRIKKKKSYAGAHSDGVLNGGATFVSWRGDIECMCTWLSASASLSGI